MAKINTDYGAQALDLNQLIDIHGGTGIVSGCSASVGTNAMEVDVASGTARVNGTNYSITASTVLLDSANSDYPRKDLVVVDNTGSVTKITGTAEEAKPAGSTRRNTRRPRPSDISGSDVAVIAEVWVGAGASDIVSGDISDRRLIPLVEGFQDVDGDDVAELQDSHADFQGGDARNVGAFDSTSVSTDELSSGSWNGIEVVESGESIQTAIDNVAGAGGGWVFLKPGVTYTESGIRLKDGVHINGFMSYQSTADSATIEAAADEPVFLMDTSVNIIAPLRNVYIDTTSVTDYSSAALKLTADPYYKNHTLMRDCHLKGDFGATTGSKAISLEDTTGAGIAWLPVAQNVHISGFNYGVHCHVNATDAFINRVFFDGVFFNKTTEFYHQSISTGAINGHIGWFRGNGATETDIGMHVEGIGHDLWFDVGDPGGFTNTAEFTSAAKKNTLWRHNVNASVSDSGTKNRLVPAGQHTVADIPGAAASDLDPGEVATDSTNGRIVWKDLTGTAYYAGGTTL